MKRAAAVALAAMALLSAIVLLRRAVRAEAGPPRVREDVHPGPSDPPVAQPSRPPEPRRTGAAEPAANVPPPSASTSPIERRRERMIVGRVVFDGKPPPRRRIKVDADPWCAARYSEERPLLDERIVVGPERGLANAMVWIKHGVENRRFERPTEAVELRQQDCRYDPHVFVVQAGQDVRVVNLDKTSHNLHSQGNINSTVNKTCKEGSSWTLRFNVAESPFLIKCDIHPWMAAWCFVSPHPLAQVTGETGQFRLGEGDAGSYEVEAWHETLGSRSAIVIVRAEEDGGVEFTFRKP